MRIIPLSEVLQMSAGEQVTCTKGKLKTILDYHKGTKDDGSEWSMQKIILTDGRDEVAAKLWDREALPSAWKGKEVYISCTQGNNNRWNGVKTKEDNYQGKSSIILNVTAAGRVDVSAPEEVGAAPGAPAPAAAPAAPAPAPAAPAPAPAPAAPAAAAPANHATTRTAPDEAAKKLADVKKSVFQRASLWGICRVMAEAEAEHLRTSAGIEMSADQKAAMVSSLFISADRDRLHYDLPLTHIDFSARKPAAK